ncbi:DUF6149 family protein [Halocalculus aciditolerans]|uniref:Uncharacterized protein n=1 Tax=Halocalculus aciditolerans TaxID=1383812 RepID=A0A830FHW0_9EURY|nr:DUF6149 family protein [Halocalculus aciditolerans]GGL54288.1 hypothetical protein GCM10009039_10560 [Halocalculus aciditolerans]
MRLYQSWKNYVAQAALGVPVARHWTRSWLVDLHADFFVDASEVDAEARRAFFEALFDASVDAYEHALDEGYPEAEAREITHIMGTFAFTEKGWGDLVEFPPAERDAYYARYEGFFERYGVAPDDPFGDFTPPGGLPDAPETPERLDGDFPLAEPGLTDDIYVPAPNVDART